MSEDILNQYFQEVLSLYLEIGVNETCDFQAGKFYHSKFEKQPKNQLINATEKTPVGTKQTKIDENLIIELREKIDKIETLSELKNLLLSVDFSLKKDAKNTVFGDGIDNAEIVLIGEAPGEEEDETGIPFCGRSGKLLAKALERINVSREKNLFITNSVFWRPPDNRKPTSSEMNFCRPFLIKILQIIHPKVVILCGATATTALFKDSKQIANIVGNSIENDDILGYKAIFFPLYHPSYLLRNPISKRDTWDHLLKLKGLLKVSL